MSEATCTRVNIDKLVVDGRYQRPIDEKRVARIIDNFDSKLLGTLELSKRKDGTYAVIDGQHRFEALKAVDRKRVPALVHEGLSVQQEADLFARTNMGRKPLTPIQRFRAQVFSGDPQSVEIQDVVTECGYRIDFSPNHTDWGVIRSVIALENIYRLQGVDHLRSTLKTLADIWFGEHSATSQYLIWGMSGFLAQFGERFDEQHAERLRRVPAVTIERRSYERMNTGTREKMKGLVADEIRKITGLRGTAGRKDQPVLSKARADELATA